MTKLGEMGRWTSTRNTCKGRNKEPCFTIDCVVRFKLRNTETQPALKVMQVRRLQGINST